MRITHWAQHIVKGAAMFSRAASRRLLIRSQNPDLKHCSDLADQCSAIVPWTHGNLRLGTQCKTWVYQAVMVKPRIPCFHTWEMLNLSLNSETAPQMRRCFSAVLMSTAAHLKVAASCGTVCEETICRCHYLIKQTRKELKIMSKSKKTVIIITSILGFIATIIGIAAIIARKVSKEIESIDLTECDVEF